jgi:HlyD family secretion protein
MKIKKVKYQITNIMKINYLLIPLTIIAAACGSGNNKSDAYGNFEAVEIQVSSEVQGKIIGLKIEEGQHIQKGQTVLMIDTTQLYFRKLQMNAQMNSAEARLLQVKSQIAVQDEQKKSLEREKKRLENLVSANAAPSKQLDDINGQLDVLNSQILATRIQNQSVLFDIKALQYATAQIDDQLSRSVIKNPIDGTVLDKYIENGEVVIPGKVLYKVADLSILRLRAYISGAQLPNIKIGQKVTVLVDKDINKNQELEGTISWISQQAEFTPKIIQTKEERVNLVYAIKIDVVNDGSLKVGMPGEVKFKVQSLKFKV